MKFCQALIKYKDYPFIYIPNNYHYEHIAQYIDDDNYMMMDEFYSFNKSIPLHNPDNCGCSSITIIDYFEEDNMNEPFKPYYTELTNAIKDSPIGSVFLFGTTANQANWEVIHTGNGKWVERTIYDYQNNSINNQYWTNNHNPSTIKWWLLDCLYMEERTIMDELYNKEMNVLAIIRQMPIGINFCIIGANGDELPIIRLDDDKYSRTDCIFGNHVIYSLEERLTVESGAYHFTSKLLDWEITNNNLIFSNKVKTKKKSVCICDRTYLVQCQCKAA